MGGVRVGWDLVIFYCHDKQHIISDYCEHDMHLIHTKREFFLENFKG